MTSPIRFYFDFASTFSYIASLKIDELASTYGRAVDWRLVSISHLFEAQKIVPPPANPAKFKYLRTDFKRSCRLAHLPCCIPAQFPPTVKLARRVFWRIKRRDESLAHDFARAIIKAIFGKGGMVESPGQIAVACAGLEDITKEDIDAAEQDDDAKNALVAALDDAISDGMIGAPYMVLDEEPFWGADRLSQLERRLAESQNREV